MINVLAYDFGTTGVKTCLFTISDGVVKVDSASQNYGLHILPNGGAEQDPDDWWDALVATTRQIVERNPERAKSLAGISFCAQMQSMVMVDAEGRAVHRSMNYMDQRATAEMKSIFGKFPTFAGINIFKAATCLRRTGIVPASVKDPVWKYHWLRLNRPEEFARGHKWLDVKETIIARMTGEFVMSRDSAFSTMLLVKNSPTPQFDPVVMRTLQIDPKHMPKIVESTDIVGKLRPEQAEELGLSPDTPVYAGGGDASLIGVGAGAVKAGDTHVYMGTSGWVSTVTDKYTVDLTAMMAAIVGANPAAFNYFSELETAGKCLEWVRDHLALDEINVFLDQRHVAQGTNAAHASLYDYLSKVIATAEPGSGGVLFTPWLHGNRSPFEDPLVRAAFFNISLETGKTEMLRAVVEGVCFHMRWFIEAHERNRHVHPSARVRFAGGGALSDTTAQILADVLQRGIDVVDTPQDAGAVGAALLVAIGTGLIESVDSADQLVEVAQSFEPNPDNAAVYDRQFEAFVGLYKANRKIYRMLNAEKALS
nr:FGGY-family carbohydrate kinase [Corynebacterium lactis]